MINKLFIVILLSITSAAAFSVYSLQNATAATNMVGYFTGVRPPDHSVSGDGVLGESGRIKSVNSIDEFYNFTVGLLDNGTQDKYAGSYIIQKAIGRQASAKNTLITKNSTAVLTEFRSRLSAYKPGSSGYISGCNVDWSRNYTYTRNSMYASYNGMTDIYEYSDSSDTTDSIVFYCGRTTDFVIKRRCGNVLGSLNLRKLDWTLSSKSTPREQTASPGDKVTLNHAISYTDNKPKFEYHVWSSHVDASTGAGRGVWNPLSGLKSSYGGVNVAEKVTIPSNWGDGDRYCQYIAYTNATGPETPSDDDKDKPACVTVKLKPFQLIPTASIQLDQEEAPTQAIYTPQVLNASTSTAKTTATTRLYNDNTGTTLATVQEDVTLAPSAIFKGATANYTKALGSLATGTKICSTVTVSPYTESISSFPSGPACQTVVNKPYFKAVNGSVMTGSCNASGILAGWFRNNNGTPPYKGASTTLASISRGPITGFGSAQITPSVSPTELAFSGVGLTPSSDSPSLGGNMSSAPCLTDATRPAITTDISTSSLGFTNATVTTNYSKSSALEITGGIIPASQRVTVFVDGNVYISGNITYANSTTWSDITQIPSLTLRAKGNIYISSNVTQLDGLYIARPKDTNTGGAIFTCATAANTASNDYTTCNKQLVINGIFAANKINLLRTYGSLNDTAGTCRNGTNPPQENTCAAEVFKLSPEIYLNGTSAGPSGTGLNFHYDSITSLPPLL